VEIKTLVYASGQRPVKAEQNMNKTHLKQFGMLRLSKNVPSDIVTVLVR
jgi:hypothetical protein